MPSYSFHNSSSSSNTKKQLSERENAILAQQRQLAARLSKSAEAQKQQQSQQQSRPEPPAPVFTNSTFNNNSAKEGGGLYLNTTSVENQINNSTFSANTASKEGGGIFMSSAERSTMNNVTIAYNHADVEGGGIYLELTPDTEITNTIIAQNTATQYPNERDCTGFGFTPTTMANSIVEDGGCNAVNIGAIQIDPELDNTLANNNGATQSHMLLAGSPARDAGNNATCEATDQRGLTRPDAQSGICDIGAIEAQPGEGSDGDFFIIPTKNGVVLIYL